MRLGENYCLEKMRRFVEKIAAKTKSESGLYVI